MNRRLIVTIGVIVSFFAVTAASCGLKAPGAKNAPTGPSISLTYWSVFDDSSAIQPIIDAYQKEHSNVSITYKKLDITEYEEELQKATLEGRGPDVFAIHNTWVPKYENRIEPITTSDVDLSQFPSVVQQDAVVGSNVYGLPLSIDTMVMYYNPTILNSAGVVFPPKTWDEFDAAMKKISLRGGTDDLTREGAAIGTVDNVNRGIDPLVLLMLQNNTAMTNNEKTEATFANTVIKDNGERYTPGLAALNKFLSYSDRTKDNYTWNTKFDSGFNQFAEGRLGFLFNYAFNLKRIQALNPNIDLRTAPVPQIDANQPVTLSNYWLQTVSKNSPNLLEAWKFVTYMTTNVDQATGYANSTNKPGALNKVLESQKGDRLMAAWANQASAARSWYQKDAASNESILRGMINDIINGKNTAQNALQLAETQITNLMR